ncbi:MAG TPA: ABC transporter ATP-binding protein [Thermoplasmata archaeon]|nr:ABC transporter ATP-binding protein [Thermoplasmata archaeon]
MNEAELNPHALTTLDAHSVPIPWTTATPNSVSVESPTRKTRAVVTVDRLHKTYGGTNGVHEVSFSVGEGEILGIIGPNGAGKTTTVECISGLRAPDSGSINVLGLDPQKHRQEVRDRVGVQLQEGSLPPRAKVREVLQLFASFYRQPADPDELLSELGLTEKRNAYYKQLSGGQKQRLSIALALVGNPKVAILDELTTGLDPQARRETWGLIEKIRDRGVTVILVTHFMDEAERLCDRVVLIDRGEVVAMATPEALAEQEGGGTHMRFVPSAPFPDKILASLPGVSSVEHVGPHVEVTGKGDLLPAVMQALQIVGVRAQDVQVTSGSLEDAFLRLTSQRTRPTTEVAGS